MNSHIKTDTPGFVRDKTSTAVLNTDSLALKEYKSERAKLLKYEQLYKDVEKLKQDVSNILNILSEVK
jgi:hypothetical protein